MGRIERKQDSWDVKMQGRQVERVKGLAEGIEIEREQIDTRDDVRQREHEGRGGEKRKKNR